MVPSSAVSAQTSQEHKVKINIVRLTIVLVVKSLHLWDNVKHVKLNLFQITIKDSVLEIIEYNAPEFIFLQLMADIVSSAGHTLEHKRTIQNVLQIFA